MDASLDLSRWRAKPRGVGYRRWTMVSTGLRQLVRLRIFKILLSLAWSAGVALAALGFLFGQSVAEGGWLETLAVYFGPRAQAIVSALGAVVLMYPDVCIGGWFTLIFWLHSYLGLWLSLVALTVLVPRLISRDRASNALTVYLARPLTSSDYLLGKLGIILGVLVLVWTGPLLFGWLLSVAFAPGRDFIVYSFEPLGRALLFHGIAVATLAAVALGVSAISRTSRNTIVVWLGLWLILGTVSQPPKAPEWLKRTSFTYDLSQARHGILKLDSALTIAGDVLPLANRDFSRQMQRAGGRVTAGDFDGALLALGAFVVLSSFVFLRRLRPE